MMDRQPSNEYQQIQEVKVNNESIYMATTEENKRSGMYQTMDFPVNQINSSQ